MPCYPLPLEFWARVETRTSWVSNFAVSNLESSDGCHRPILTVPSIISITLSRGVADSEHNRFGTDINKCSFRLVSPAFDFKSAWRLDFCIVTTILTNVKIWNFDRRISRARLTCIFIHSCVPASLGPISLLPLANQAVA